MTRKILILFIFMFSAVSVTAQDPPSANVTEIFLSTELLVLECEPGIAPREGEPPPSKSMVVDVVTRSAEPKKDRLIYRYIVSYGSIIGQGPTVKWDLTDAPPGTHTISVSVSDVSETSGPTVTKTIIVNECGPSCIQLPPCPSVQIISPETLDSFQEYFVETKILGGDGLDIEWSVTNGEIIGGQGTRKVNVKTGSLTDMTAFSLSVRLSRGEYFADCTKTFTVTYKSINGKFVKDAESTSK
jgi:hypothetical protein